MQLVLNIDNKSVAEKILWLLEHFKKDGLKISNSTDMENKLQQQEYSDEYIEQHWRELAMTHEDPGVDDDERLEQAHANWNKDE